MILEEQFPVPRNTSVSKIGNSVILLLWQLRCRCNPDHKRFSSLSNTTVVAIFPKLCLWRRRLSSNLGGIAWPWKTVSSHLNKDYFTGQFMVFLKVITKPALKDGPLFSVRANTPFGGYRKNYSRLLDMRWLQPTHIQATHIHTASYPYSYHPSSQLISTRGKNS